MHDAIIIQETNSPEIFYILFGLSLFYRLEIQNYLILNKVALLSILPFVYDVAAAYCLPQTSVHKGNYFMI